MTQAEPIQQVGALVRPDGVLFRVWAPTVREVVLVLEDTGELWPLEPGDHGYHERLVPVPAGTRYRYRLEAGDFPDPASRYQPEGVHGPSEVVDPSRYAWKDGHWRGLDQHQLVFYELHVGTFTPEGTFAAAAERLDHLAALGVTAIELMPLADFPGRWSWGYDQAALFAPARAYGSPDELRRLVDQAHQRGLAVFVDVIYNHFGPDGAYAGAFGPFHSGRHTTPWGDAINLDDTHSEGVRAFFVANALHWLVEYHVDGLRLDAVHALIDDGPRHFLAELSAAVAALPGRKRYLVAEDERNLRRLLEPRSRGGYGLDAVWADDFHHQIRNLTTGETEGYFADFADTDAPALAATLERGWFYTGQRSKRRGQPRGTDPQGLAPERFVLCIQNHDQVGNRPAGDRLHHKIPLPAYRAVSALLLFAPQLPLLFMGQEWAASTPFQFFTDHHDQLGRLVSQGRRREFEDFESFSDAVPDPQDPATFARSKLHWPERLAGEHEGILALYRDLLELRQQLDGTLVVQAHGRWGLALHRGADHLLVALRDGVALPVPQGTRVVLHTEQRFYTGAPLAPDVGASEVRFARPGAALFRR